MLSNVASVLSIVGFAITLWQLCSFKKELKEATKKGQQHVLDIAKISTASSAIQLTEGILWDIQHGNFGVASCKVQELNTAIIEICESGNYSHIGELSSKQRYLPIIIRATLEIDRKPELVASYKVSFFQEKLQDVHDELKKVETRFKKTIISEYESKC